MIIRLTCEWSLVWHGRYQAEVRRVCAHYGGGSSGAKEGEGDVAMIRLQRLIDPAAYDIQRRAHTPPCHVCF